MSPVIQKIEQEFKELTPIDQAKLFERFAKFMYGEEEEGPAFIGALKRRVAEIDSGAITGRDAFEVLKEGKSRHSS